MLRCAESVKKVPEWQAKASRYGVCSGWQVGRLAFMIGWWLIATIWLIIFFNRFLIL